MYKTIGERITYCRNLLGISRREFVEAIGDLSLPTLSRWELNYTEISKPKVEILVNFLKQSGIDVGVEWILTENGQAPINRNLVDFEKLNFDEISYITLSNLKNQIENFEIYQINSNFFEPVIYYGDYIGGLPHSNFEMLTNKLCFIIQNKLVSIGIFNFEHMNISNIYKQTIKIDVITKIGAVLWLAKRS